MPPISKQKRNKISEQILHHLYSIAPQSIFTSQIAQEIARDEEFAKSLLQELEKSRLIIKIAKNPQGVQYQRRQRWRLSNSAFEVFKKHQKQ